METIAITRAFLEEHYRGNDAHSTILLSVEKGIKTSPLGELLNSQASAYVDGILRFLYRDLPDDPGVVVDRIRDLEPRGVSEGVLIIKQLEIEAFLKNTERGAEIVPVRRLYGKRLDYFIYA